LRWLDVQRQANGTPNNWDFNHTSVLCELLALLLSCVCTPFKYQTGFTLDGKPEEALC